MTSDVQLLRRLSELNLSWISRHLARAAGMGGLAALVACATPPNADAPAQPVGSTSSKPAPMKPAPPVAAKPVAPAPAPVTLTPQEAQRAVLASIEYLEAGQEELADAELQKVVQSEPGNRLAQSLLKQIHEDPFALFGEKSFAYRVPAGESLSRIAQRFLNDPLQFYGLARYNNIKVPRTLGEGQMLRIPGRAPTAGATPAPPLRENPVAATGSGPSSHPAPPSPPPVTTTPAPTPIAPPDAAPAAPSAVVEVPPAAEPAAARNARMAKQKAEAVTRHTRSARAAFAKQDLQGALLGWDAVLAIEPDNRTALLERQKVLSLMEKLGKVK